MRILPSNRFLVLCGNQATNKAFLNLCQIALNAENELPEWIQLIPAGKEITALDGRKFKNSNPQQIVDVFNKDPRDVPIDWQHASELKAPKGEQAPASGWVKEMEVREGAVWARVEWTPKGVESLKNKEYRYISPAFYVNKAKEIIEIISAGLVNRPALDMPALAQTNDDVNRTTSQPLENHKMLEKLLALLKLSEETTEDQALEALAALISKNVEMTSEIEKAKKQLAAQTPVELDKFVPRADYDVAIASMNQLKEKVAVLETNSKQEKIDTAIAAALKAGKITPATVEYHKSLCAIDGGLEKFQKFVEDAPVVVADSDLDSRDKPTSTDKLTEVEKQVARDCGIDPEKVIEVKKLDYVKEFLSN